jgi:hypothetical protein
MAERPKILSVVVAIVDRSLEDYSLLSTLSSLAAERDVRGL